MLRLTLRLLSAMVLFVITRAVTLVHVPIHIHLFVEHVLFQLFAKLRSSLLNEMVLV